MPTLPLSVTDFDKAFIHLNGERCYTFTINRLIHAAIFSGRSARDARNPEKDAWLQALWRLTTICAGLNFETNTGAYPLRPRVGFSHMDPSEKRLLTYFIGNAVAKLVSEECLCAPWILHHDVYRKFLRSPLGAHQTRPDFVGWTYSVGQHSATASPWFTMESKGGIRKLGAKGMTKAKDQAKALPNVRNQPTALHVVSCSYFQGGILRAWLKDPEFDEDMSLDVDIKNFAWEYYEPIKFLIRHREYRLKGGEEIYEVPEADLQISVVTDFAEWIRSNDVNTLDIDVENLPLLLALTKKDESYGLDGVGVTLGPSWYGRAKSS